MKNSLEYKNHIHLFKFLVVNIFPFKFFRIPPTEEEIEEAELEYGNLEEKMKSPAKNKNKQTEKVQEERFTEPVNKRVRFADTDSG